MCKMAQGSGTGACVRVCMRTCARACVLSRGEARMGNDSARSVDGLVARREGGKVAEAPTS